MYLVPCTWTGLWSTVTVEFSAIFGARDPPLYQAMAGLCSRSEREDARDGEENVRVNWVYRLRWIGNLTILRKQREAQAILYRIGQHGFVACWLIWNYLSNKLVQDSLDSLVWVACSSIISLEVACLCLPVVGVIARRDATLAEGNGWRILKTVDHLEWLEKLVGQPWVAIAGAKKFCSICETWILGGLDKFRYRHRNETWSCTEFVVQKWRL